MNSANDVALRVVAALEDAGLTCAIGGALAFGRWVRPRSTLDADINVFVDEERYDDVLDALEAIGVATDRTESLRRFERGDVAIMRLDGIRVDLFVPSIPFYEDAERTIVTVDVDGRPVPFLSPETLAVFKLLFFRGKDLRDLEAMVEELGPTLDVAWVRARVASMMGEDDERVSAWDAIVASGRR